LLEAILESPQPVSERELAENLASHPAQSRSVDEIHYRLHHLALPKLDEAGLVTWDESDGTVRAAGDVAVRTARPTRPEEPPGRRDPATNDPAIEASNTEGPATGDTGTDAATERRRAVVALLEDGTGPTDRAALAYELAVREHGGAITSEAVEGIEMALHHADLPTLDRSGLLEYDAGSGTVVPAR
jgi:hypothetical protein